MEDIRKAAAQQLVSVFASLPGIDVLPAAFPRFLTAVYQRTGLKFTHIGHGRHREVFDVTNGLNVFEPQDLGLVLKIGNRQSNTREIALTLMYPEDWAKIYATFDYGVVSERASMVTGFDDPRTKTPEFVARIEDLNSRYIGLKNEDVGFVGDRIITVGSSTRVIRKDAGINGQIRAV
jgi:hypothetical protein